MVSAAALALSMSAVPTLVAHAEGGGDDGVGIGAAASAGATVAPANVTASSTFHVQLPGGAGEEGSEGNQEREQEGPRAGERASSTLTRVLENRIEHFASGTAEEHATSSDVIEGALAHFAAQFGISLSATSTPVSSFEQLLQSIKDKRDALDLEASTTATSSRPLLEEANKVRLAAHALVAARDLMGSTTVGADISQIAQQVNDSLATTTLAQSQIQARGFWTKLLFGGDSAAAAQIQQEVVQNQARITQLTQLLAQASTSAQVKTELTAQIQAMQEQQTALAAEAQAQQNQWGIFSWRL